jgi:hypothetical protein
MPIDFPLATTVASPDGRERAVEVEVQTRREPRVVRTATFDAGGRPATVGATACGKPVGSRLFESDIWAYSVITFAVRNARGEGEYFDGLPPTCAAGDDLTHELGDPAEASLPEALHYVENGRCSPEAVRAAAESGVVL